jgi:hypothetical protein
MPQARAIAEASPGAMGPAAGAGRLTMLDAASLVTGAAVASVHFRDFDEEIGGLGLLGWALLIPAFAWLALTAAGPFVFLGRRFSRRPDGYPGPYDRLWLGFGLPWVVAALVRSALGGLPDGTGAIYSGLLFIALAAATIPALGQLWRSLPRIEPTAVAGPAPSAPPKPESWTGRIGRAVAVLWPLQFGLGLAVTQ